MIAPLLQRRASFLLLLSADQCACLHLSSIPLYNNVLVRLKICYSGHTVPIFRSGCNFSEGASFAR